MENQQVTTGPINLGAAMLVETFDLDIRFPGGTQSTGWVWKLAGPSHPKAVARMNEQARQSLRRQAQIDQQQANGKKVKVDEKSPEEQRQENAEWIASRTLGFNSVTIPPVQAEPIEWSDAKVVELMVRADMGWVFSQVVDYLNSDRAFTQRSAGI